MVINDMESSYQSAEDYSLFYDSTSSGNEGGWYGFKRTDVKVSYAIIMLGYYGIFNAYRVSGTWKLYHLYALDW